MSELPVFPSTADVYAQVMGLDPLRNGEPSVLFWSHGLGSHRVEAVFVNVGHGGETDWRLTYAIDPEDGDRYLSILVPGHPVDIQQVLSSRVRQILRARITDEDHEGIVAAAFELVQAAFELSSEVCWTSGEEEYRLSVETSSPDDAFFASFGLVVHSDAPEFSCVPTAKEIARNEDAQRLCKEFTAAAERICEAFENSVVPEDIIHITRMWPQQRDVSALN